MSFDQIAWFRRKVTSEADGENEGQQLREEKVELINLDAGELSSKAEDMRASIGRMGRIAHWLIHDGFCFALCRCGSRRIERWIDVSRRESRMSNDGTVARRSAAKRRKSQ